MSKSIIRSIVLSLCVVLVFGLLGCGTNNDSGQQTATTTTSATTTTGSSTTESTQTSEETDPFEKKLDISWLGLYMSLLHEDSMIQQIIEEKFNVSISFPKVDVQNTEQVNLMIATGEMPDAAFLYLAPATFYQQGVSRTVPEAAIREFAPMYSELVDRYPTGWLMNTAPDKENEYICVTGLTLNTDFTTMLPMYRLDWLENLGIEAKGELIQLDDRVFFSKEPFTLEEQQEIFRKFTFDDPNNSGENDTYALSGSSDKMFTFGPFMYEFGMSAIQSIQGNSVMQADGNDIPYIASSQLKEFLKFVQQLNNEKVLDPEWTTLNRPKHWEKIAAGMVGYAAIPQSYVTPSLTDRPPYSVIAADPSSKILVTGADALGTWTVNAHSYSFYIGKQVDDEKLGRILRIFDYVNMDKEGRILTRFGVENEHFEWEGEPYNSAIISKLADGQMHELGIESFRFHIIDDEIIKYVTVKQYFPINEYLMSEESEQKRVRPYRIDLFGNTGIADLMTQYSSELTRMFNEFFYNSITGAIDIDAKWDEYVNELKKAGLDKIMEEMKKFPILEYVRQGEIRYDE